MNQLKHSDESLLPVPLIATIVVLLSCTVAFGGDLLIHQDPGTMGEPVNFIASGSLELSATDSVAEFIVEFAPKSLSNPLGDFSPFSSFRTVDWGPGQDLSRLTVTEFVSDGDGQIVPIAGFEPITMNDTGYTAGDVPFPAEFPFALREFGVRIEGLQGEPTVTFQKDARTDGRGGGQVSHVARNYAAVEYDNLRDDIEVFEYQLAGAGTLEDIGDGLNFRSTSPAGVDFYKDGEHVIVADGISIRAQFTINEVVALGLAGVGFENPARWAAVLGADHDKEFGVGEDFRPDKVKIPSGEITNDPFVVQLDFTEDSLIGYFWRPESPLDVTKIEYGQDFRLSSGPLRLANNGTDVTYHDVWVSESHIPLPTGFEEQGDFNGNRILDLADLQFVSSNIQLGDDQTDLNADGIVDQVDLSIWVKEYYGTWIGDANLDGEFNSGDLVAVFGAGEYEDNVTGNSTWSTGDWNGDGEFDTGDLIRAFQDRGFEQGGRGLAAVPESTSSTFSLICLATLLLRHSRRGRAT